MSSRITLPFWLSMALVYLCCSAKVHGVPTPSPLHEELPSEDAPESSTEHFMSHYELEQSIMKNLTSKDLSFHSKLRPSGTTPTKIKVNMFVRDVKMKTGSPIKLSQDLYNPWTADIVLRQKWNDPRLAYNVGSHSADYSYFPLNSAKLFWKPDTFFPDADKGDFHFITTPNTFVWLYPNGDVLYSLRLEVSFPCRQNSFPTRFGHGIGIPVACPLRLSSYGYTSDQVTYEWDDKDPLEVNQNLYTPNNANYCSLDKVHTNGTKEVNARVGNFSVISSEFEFLC
jgi:hypothetical protein